MSNPNTLPIAPYVIPISIKTLTKPKKKRKKQAITKEQHFIPVSMKEVLKEMDGLEIETTKL
jgi:hypothetical protein